MSKSEIRTSLNEMKVYVKLSILCEEYGLSQPALSRFMKNSWFDNVISYDQILGFYNYCCDKIKNLT